MNHAHTTDAATPVLYDAMCRAIDSAYAVDEVKEIRDKARAMEMYLRQAKNTEAERRACEIRLRAERKAGQLLEEREKAKPGPRPSPELGNFVAPNSAPSLDGLGITKRQSSDWQRLARVPEDEFEAALADPIEKPTTAGIIRAATAPSRPAVSNDALWLWGRMKDFDRDGLLSQQPADVLLTMTPEMLDDVHALAPRVAHWLLQIGRTL